MHCHADLVVKAPSSITAHHSTDIRSHRNLNNSACSTWHLHNLDPSTAADVSTSETWLLSSRWEWPSVAWDGPIWSTRSNTSLAWWNYTIMFRSITSPVGLHHHVHTSPVGLHHHVQVHHQPSGTTPSCTGPSPAWWDYTIMCWSITSPVGLRYHVQIHCCPVNRGMCCTTIMH